MSNLPAPKFVDQLKDEPVELDRILLDPNNPRLIGLYGYTGVREDRVAEPGVQQATLNRLNSHRPFDQESLRDSIEESGLILIDRIVVRPLPDSRGQADQRYIVVEGNRRIAACKTLLEQHERGEKTLGDKVLASIKAPHVLVMADADVESARLDQWVIQGIRHISGTRPWGAYQVARTIEAMVNRLGYPETDVAKALGVPAARVRRAIRVLSVLQQMSDSEDYSEYATPDSYGYFDEILKRPAVRKWLGWNDSTMVFEDEVRLEQFYSWMTPDDELDGGRRIAVAENVRKLDSVLDDSSALAVLNTPGNTIDDALRVTFPQVAPDWTDPIKRAIKALDGVPIGDLENLSDDSRKLINDLIQLAQRRLTQADSFKP